MLQSTINNSHRTGVCLW